MGGWFVASTDTSVPSRTIRLQALVAHSSHRHISNLSLGADLFVETACPAVSVLWAFRAIVPTAGKTLFGRMMLMAGAITLLPALAFTGIPAKLHQAHQDHLQSADRWASLVAKNLDVTEGDVEKVSRGSLLFIYLPRIHRDVYSVGEGYTSNEINSVCKWFVQQHNASMFDWKDLTGTQNIGIGFARKVENIIQEIFKQK